MQNMKLWKDGIFRLKANDIRELNRIKFKGKLICVIPSSTDKPNLASVHNLLLPLHSFKSTISFEMWMFHNKVSFFLFSEEADKLGTIKSQVNALYPNAQFKDAEMGFIPLSLGDYICSAYVDLEHSCCWTKWLGQFEYDPLSHLLEAMNTDSSVMLQVMFRPTKLSDKCIERMRRRVEKDLEPMMYRQAMVEASEKMGMPCFSALARMVAISSDPNKAGETIESTGNVFAVFNGRYACFEPRMVRFPIFRNSLSVFKAILKRQFPRLDRTFILSVPELASLIHLPVGLNTAKISSSFTDRCSAESSKGITIGFKKFRGQATERVEIPLEDLSRHVYMLGATGTGKTSLLINMVNQAVERGICVHFIDPHGDASYDLVQSLPERKMKDVVFLDPLKVRFSINPFKLPPYRDQYDRSMKIEIIIGQMVELLKRIFGSRYWGPSLNRTFQNVVRLLYMRDDSPTFEDVLNILIGKVEGLGMLSQDDNFRELQQELRKQPYERLDAVKNKIEPFVRNATLRMIFCNKQSTVDFDELLQPGKIVVWRLSKVDLTEQNMQMIGSAIITNLWFYCASRLREGRNPVLLAIDEFQNFGFLETLSIIITEARKFGIGLILIHQTVQQLEEQLFSEVLGNTASKIIFRVSGNDASILSRSLDIENREELMRVLAGLPDGCAVVKLRAAFGQEPTPPFEVFAPKPVQQHAVDFQQLIGIMQERYSAPPPTFRIQTPPQREFREEFLRFLQEVGRIGEKGKLEMSKALKVSPSALNETIEKAESEGYILTCEVETKGRPKTEIRLTEKGEQALRQFLGREGGLLHKQLIERAVEHFESQGCEVEVPVQGGRREQPDLIVREFGGETLYVEVETKADHPEQVRRNYEKSRMGRVVFIVPSEDVGARVRKILGDGEVYVLPL